MSSVNPYKRVVGVVVGGVAGAALAYLIVGEAAPVPCAGDAAGTQGALAAETMAGAERKPSTQGQVEALVQRVDALAAKLAVETAERRRVQGRLDAVAAQLAMLANDTQPSAQAAADPSAPEVVASNPATAAADAAVGAAQAEAAQVAEAAASTTFERALVTAGLDPQTVTEIKRRRDDLTMAEMFLRDRANREQWADSPRFQDEMAAIEQQQMSLREEIGDDAYDRYLAAAGEPNRVRVEDVMMESPAAVAGLQRGDLVLRYGDARIFAPADLVAETRVGTAGEWVPLEVLRQGQRLQISVPRGPLGLRIAASQAPAGEG